MKVQTVEDVLPPGGFVRLPTILKLIPMSRSAFYRRIETGEFPAPLKLSPTIACWRSEDIRALIERLSRDAAA